MHIDRSNRFPMFFFIILLLLGNSTSLIINELDSKIDEKEPMLDFDRLNNKVNNYDDLTSNVIEKTQTISSGEKKRIIWYKSFEKRDQALQQIPDNLISHVYKNFPAFSTKPISDDIIPINGVDKVIDDRKAYYKSSDNQVKNIDSLVRTGVSLEESAQLIGANVLHSLGYKGEGIKIAVLDSGISSDLDSFDDYNGNSRVTEMVASELEVWLLENLDLQGFERQDVHGTQVAGIAASNGMYKSDGKFELYDSPGIAPGASILSIRVLDPEGFGEISWIVDGIDIAIKNGANIISMSLSSELYGGELDVHREIINTAVAQGITVIAAAGNLGPYGSGIGLPAALESVIAVGALDMEEETVWSNSAVGPKVDGYPGPDLIAPGRDIITVNTKGEYSQVTGTSMATPQVSGGIALLMQAFPNATVHQIREAITASAMDVNDYYGIYGVPVEQQGNGILNLPGAFYLLNKTVHLSTVNDTFAMKSSPSRISDINYYFRNQIFNVTKTFPAFIYSSRNITVIPQVDNLVGLNFSLPSIINLVAGLNKFYLNLTITVKKIGYARGHVYFIDKNSNQTLPYANITYAPSLFGSTLFGQSKIIFDTSHDADYPDPYFGNHGPRGQFSKFAQIIEDEGHMIYEHKSGNLTDSILEKFDLLIIADPDKDYTSSEIQAIQKFSQDDGKSLLLIVGGGFLVAEEYSYDSYNGNAINNILKGSGLQVRTDENSIVECDEDLNNDARRFNCFDYATMNKNLGIFSKQFEFANFGPELIIEDSIHNSQVLAKMNGKPVVMASDLVSTGRIIVFSSPLIFDNQGLLFNYGLDGSALDNGKIIKETINWLIEPRIINPDYSVNNKKVQTSTTVNLHQISKITLSPKTPTDGKITMGEVIYVSYMFYDNNPVSGMDPPEFNVKEFTLNANGDYIYSEKFERSGYYDFYFHIELEDYIPTNSHLRLYVELNNFDDQDTFRSISRYILFAIMVSWILWIINEGGRRKKAIEGKKETE